MAFIFLTKFFIAMSPFQAVEKQRKKLVQNKSSSDELAWEPGFMEECSSLDGNANFSTSSIWQCESK